MVGIGSKLRLEVGGCWDLVVTWFSWFDFYCAAGLLMVGFWLAYLCMLV